MPNTQVSMLHLFPRVELHALVGGNCSPPLMLLMLLPLMLLLLLLLVLITP